MSEIEQIDEDSHEEDTMSPRARVATTLDESQENFKKEIDDAMADWKRK